MLGLKDGERDLKVTRRASLGGSPTTNQPRRQQHTDATPARKQDDTPNPNTLRFLFTSAHTPIGDLSGGERDLKVIGPAANQANDPRRQIPLPSIQARNSTTTLDHRPISHHPEYIKVSFHHPFHPEFSLLCLRGCERDLKVIWMVWDSDFAISV